MKPGLMRLSSPTLTPPTAACDYCTAADEIYTNIWTSCWWLELGLVVGARVELKRSSPEEIRSRLVRQNIKRL